MPPSSSRFVRGVADRFRTDGPFDEHYDVPFTTATVNQIEGGIAVNTVPAVCSLTFEFRAVGAVDVDATIEGSAPRRGASRRPCGRRTPSARVEVSIGAQAPGLDTADDEDVIELVTGLGADASEEKVAYGTEAGLFQRAGIPTVVCGPGDIAQAHAPDEFVALEQIERCDALLDNLITHLSA